jgi:hypothetical protein
LEGWLAGGALIDGNVLSAPNYTGGLTPAEKEAMKKMKDLNKAKKK